LTYPLSAEVTAGQPTAAAQYNALRKDALTLGNDAANSLNLAQFFNRFTQFMTISILATNRLRVPYSVSQPPTIMINGYLLQAAANVDLPAGQFSGAAATWYIFAVRSAASTTFTLAVNTSAAEPTDQRLIGECNWDGSNLISVKCYFTPVATLPSADYDSGWFAVTTGGTYTKAHGFGQLPRIVELYWCASSNGAGNNIPVFVVYTNSPFGSTESPLYMDATNVYAATGTGSQGGMVVHSIPTQASSGYYRILAWK
jgi:hypothetical protein